MAPKSKKPGWEEIQKRGYWVWYFLIPLFCWLRIAESYQRRDGHEWLWALLGAIVMFWAVVKRP